MIRIYLPEEHNPLIIVEYPTGITYHVQAGGAVCAQVWAEGYIVPLSYPDVEYLIKIFGPRAHGPDWIPHGRRFDAQPLAGIDLCLSKLRDGALDDLRIRLDTKTAKVLPWGEAWVPVTLNQTIDGNRVGVRGWLTWPNSD